MNAVMYFRRSQFSDLMRTKNVRQGFEYEALFSCECIDACRGDVRLQGNLLGRRGAKKITTLSRRRQYAEGVIIPRCNRG